MSRGAGPAMLRSDRVPAPPRLERAPDQDERAEIIDRWSRRGQSTQTIATLLNLKYATIARIVGEPF